MKQNRSIRIGAAESKEKLRTLWKAHLRIQTNRDEFLFRSSEEVTVAVAKAQELLDSSPMVGAEIIGVERIARLWN